MDSSQYWLWRWIDEYQVQADWEVRNLLSDRNAVGRLIDLIHEEEVAPADHMRQPEPMASSIVVGSSLDLSGDIACGGYDCLRRDIDTIFYQIWHYFDEVVVTGLEAGDASSMIRSSGIGSVIPVLDENARILLHLRNIGAEKWIRFIPRSHLAGGENLLERAAALGVEDAFQGARHENIVQNFLRTTRFEPKAASVRNEWPIRLSGGYFREAHTVHYYNQKRPSRDQVARDVLASYGQAAVRDATLANNLRLPLLQPTTVPWIGSAKSVLTTEDVEMNLRLPTFSELSVADFLKMREDERPSFEKFRKELRDQIRIQLDSADGSASAVDVAREIENSYLRPGLAEIEQNVRGSRKALIKKGGMSFGIASSVATIGAVSSVPMMIAGTIVALGSAVPIAPLVGAYIDEMNKELPVHRLYFLWRLKKNSKHWK